MKPRPEHSRGLTGCGSQSMGRSQAWGLSLLLTSFTTWGNLTSQGLGYLLCKSGLITGDTVKFSDNSRLSYLAV